MLDESNMLGWRGCAAAGWCGSGRLPPVKVIRRLWRRDKAPVSGDAIRDFMVWTCDRRAYCCGFEVGVTSACQPVWAVASYYMSGIWVLDVY